MEVGGDWDAVEDGGEGLGCPVLRCPVRAGHDGRTILELMLPDEPVCDVDVVGYVFWGGVLLEDGADGDVEIPRGR